MNGTPGHVDTVISAVPARSAAVLIEGPPGIGKTHRWTQAADTVTAAGWRLLVARPGLAEMRLGGNGLIDLLADVTNDELDALPGPQRRALLAGLLRADAVTDTDPRVLAVALTTLVRGLAEAGPLVLAIDDVQWLDPHTASMLGYLARRCPEAGVGFLMTRRTSPDAPAEARADAGPEAAGSPVTDLAEEGLLTRIEVRPMDAQAITALLRSRLDLRLPTALVSRAAATSGGNPFYAVELARVWAGATDALLDALPVPESLQALVGARIAALPDATRATLAAVSALGRATVADLRALGLAEHIAPAERAGLIVVEQGAVRFTHPLLAAAAYDRLTGTERAALHQRAAAIVEDVEQRARHLAFATQSEGPDSIVAGLLDEAVRRAERRADVNAAVEAARLAVRSSPAGDPETAARRLTLGRLLFKTGDTDAARAELDQLTGAPTARRVRVRALTMLCELAFAAISLEAAQQYGEAAIATAEPGTDDDLLAEAYIHLANGTNDRELAETALQLVESAPSPNPATHATALALVAGQRFFSGRGLDRDSFERALALEEQAQVGVEDSMAGYYLAVLSYSDDTDDAMALCDRQERRCTEEGVESQHGFTLMWRSHLLLKSGRLAEAADTIARHIAVCVHTGQVHNARYGRYNEGRLALLRGQLVTARSIGEELIATGIPAIEIIGLRVAGEAALYDGDLDAAVRYLRRVEDLAAGGRDDPSALTHLPPLIEALVAMGRTDEAQAPLEHLHRQAEATGRRSARAMVTRCRAVMATAAGDEAAAVAAFDESLATFDGTPLVTARTLLLKGQALRRFRRKAQAKQTLTESRELFAKLGAAAWAERVEQELARVGLRPPAPTDLTPTEQRVVELTATGLSAKDVAGVLFVSPRTVEAHLGRAYRKLGLRSRAELVARFAPGRTP